jgi:hypothetical protein
VLLAVQEEEDEQPADEEPISVNDVAAGGEVADVTTKGEDVPFSMAKHRVARHNSRRSAQMP